MLNGIVESLFSVCATLGVVPIIRSPRHNAAEHVAEVRIFVFPFILCLQRLDKKLRENLRDARNNLFVGEGVRGQLGALQRPLLLIADRAHDLATMLHHTWSYQALIHDVLVRPLLKLPSLCNCRIQGSRLESCCHERDKRQTQGIRYARWEWRQIVDEA